MQLPYLTLGSSSKLPIPKKYASIIIRSVFGFQPSEKLTSPMQPQSPYLTLDSSSRLPIPKKYASIIRSTSATKKQRDLSLSTANDSTLTLAEEDISPPKQETKAQDPTNIPSNSDFLKIIFWRLESQI
jgi:hypothetical protein